VKIFKNFLYNSSYQLLAVVIPLVTSPYISRVLEPEGVGLSTITYSSVQYFVLVATLGTLTYGNREIAYYQKDKIRRSQAFWGINFLSWITSGIAILSFLVFISFIKEYKELYLWQGVAILASMFDISWYFMGMERFKVTVVRNFIFKILTMFAIFIFVHRATDLWIYIAILSLGTLGSSLSLWPYLKDEVLIPDFKNLELKRHFKYTLALFIPTITVQIYAALNRNMIGAFDSVIHAGFFDQSDKIIKISLSLVTSLGVVMLPRVANLHARGDVKSIHKLFQKTFDLVSGISICLMFGVLAISLKFAPFFFGKGYSLVGPIMMIESPVIVFTTWGVIFSNQYLVPLNRLRPLTTSVVIGTIFNILANLLLIPLIGVMGATINITLSEFIISYYKYFSIRKEFKLRELFEGIWKYLFSGMVMFLIVFMMNQTFKMNALQLLLQLVVGVISYSLLNILLKTQLWVMFRRLLQQRKAKTKISID
jgi:O-antigen/teichoic acid export membrane protein